MAGGTSVGRSWVVILHNGTVVIDWGDRLFQDVVSGEFVQVAEQQISHCAQDSDLYWLKHIGRVEEYDNHQVTFASLPERLKRAIE